MKYYLIAGEASGDLHAAHLMKELKTHDSKALFRFWGGEQMKAQGGQCVRHYKETAFMGFIPVLLHLKSIMKNMRLCKKDILAWHPDVLILVDYPGFNLSIAKYIRKRTDIPIFYYISPKIWAWKEHRIKNIKRDVDALFSILPFEVDFFTKKHHYPVYYVGNPTLDEIEKFQQENPPQGNSFSADNSLSGKPLIALLAGSRKQEIKSNLRIMCDAAKPYSKDYELIIAGAPGIEADFYEKIVGDSGIKILYGQTFNILNHATAALVTSGTATLETALFGVPQVVCYHISCGKLVSALRKLFLKVPYISLVNLIAGKEVVTELVADGMNKTSLRQELEKILPGNNNRELMLEGYKQIRKNLGAPGAPAKAAALMVNMLKVRTGQKKIEI